MDFLSRLLRKSPAREMFASLVDQEPSQNASAVQTNGDQVLTNEAPGPNNKLSVQAKNNKISDVKNNSKEAVFLTPYQDHAYRVNPEGDVWTDEQRNQKENIQDFDKSPLQESLSSRKQKVFNVITESFETPDTSIIGDQNLSLLATREHCELGQDPLSIIVESLNQNTDSYLQLADSEELVQNNIKTSNISVPNLNTSAEIDIDKSTNQEDIDSGNIDFTQDEGIAIVSSDVQDEKIASQDIGNFSEDTEKCNIDPYLTQGHNSCDSVLVNCSKNKCVQEIITNNSVLSITDKNVDNDFNQTFTDTDITRNIIEHMKGISEVKNSITCLLDSSRNLNKTLPESESELSTSVHLHENYDVAQSEGIAIIQEEIVVNESCADNYIKLQQMMNEQQSHEQTCITPLESHSNVSCKEDIKNNDSESSDLTVCTSKSSEESTKESNKSSEVIKTPNGIGNSFECKFTLNDSEPMDCDDYDISVANSAIPENGCKNESLYTGTENFNPFETKTRIANTPDKDLNIPHNLNSVSAEGMNQTFGISEPMECDVSFNVETQALDNPVALYNELNKSITVNGAEKDEYLELQPPDNDIQNSSIEVNKFDLVTKEIPIPNNPTHSSQSQVEKVFPVIEVSETHKLVSESSSTVCNVESADSLKNLPSINENEETTLADQFNKVQDISQNQEVDKLLEALPNVSENESAVKTNWECEDLNSPYSLFEFHAKSNEALNEASAILKDTFAPISIESHLSSVLNIPTDSVDPIIVNDSIPQSAAAENNIQHQEITVETLKVIQNSNSTLSMESAPDGTFEIESETLDEDADLDLPLEIEKQIMNTDLDGLDTDSDSVSVCSSINPSELNPFETRCKIQNTPDRDIDVTLTTNTIISESEAALDEILCAEKEKLLHRMNKSITKSPPNNNIKLDNRPHNLSKVVQSSDSVSSLLKNALTDDQCNANMASFNVSIANGEFVKNSTSFKDNLERMNDKSPECHENTPKSTNIIRSELSKQQTDHRFASPLCRDRRLNHLSKRNVNEKVQNVKNLSPMSRCGDLMGMSPVSRDGEVKGGCSPLSKVGDFLTGDHFKYSNMIDDLEEEFKMPGEMFKDPAAFDYLLTCGTGGGRDLCKESLLVKFDPLVGARGALPTGTRPVRQEQLVAPPKLEEDASTASGLAESCSSDSSLCISNSEQAKTLSTMSSIEQSLGALSLQSQGVQQHSAANCSTPSVANNIVNVTSQPTEKPTQVVTPAISTRQQYLPSTPLTSKNPATPAKSVTSALAAIDRLLSLGGTPPPPPVVVQPKEPDMDPRLVAELQSVRELLSRQEEELRQKDDRAAALQKQLNDANAREQALIDRVNEKNRDHRQMDMVMEEYERTMSQFIGEREMEKRQWGEEKTALMKERDEANSHLANMEYSFNDIHAKYERCKTMVQGYKTNEEVLKETVRLNEDASKKQLERYEQFRQHAMSQLEIANQEIDAVKRSSQSEIIKLQAMLKKSDIQVASLQESLSQKVKDIEDLTAICDDLIQKVG